MAFSAEDVVLTDALGNQYKVGTLDPRAFTNVAGTVFSGFQPQVGDIITISADGIEGSVDLLGMVSEERVASLQRHAAMTIIYKSDNIQTRNCFPTKLGEMLIYGIPVITTTVGDANYYLEDGKSALIIKPDDEDSLVQCIRFILDNPAEAKRIGLAGRDVALKYFNPIYQGQRLSEFYNALFVRETGLN